MLRDSDDQQSCCKGSTRYVHRRSSQLVLTLFAAVLFGSNTFSLSISARAHHPVSLKSPLIFGPFGLPHRLHLLRDLRRIDLEVNIDQVSSYTFMRHRARLRHFVDVIKEHADDDSKRSLLKRLHVHLDTLRLGDAPLQTPAANNEEVVTVGGRHMFVLEVLASIQVIPKVLVSGVSRWFKQCLKLRMREGGKLEEVKWPTKIVKRKVDEYKRAKKTEVSTRQARQPTMDWRSFAERNRIELPSNIGSFFPAAQIEEQQTH